MTIEDIFIECGRIEEYNLHKEELNSWIWWNQLSDLEKRIQTKAIKKILEYSAGEDFNLSDFKSASILVCEFDWNARKQAYVME